MRSRLICLIALLAAGFRHRSGPGQGTLEPRELPPLAHPDDPATPAKELFGRESGPAPLAARTIGFYSRGCLAGGQPLPVNGPAWQVMRLSRNRQNFRSFALPRFCRRMLPAVLSRAESKADGALNLRWKSSNVLERRSNPKEGLFTLHKISRHYLSHFWDTPSSTIAFLPDAVTNIWMGLFSAEGVADACAAI